MFNDIAAPGEGIITTVPRSLAPTGSSLDAPPGMTIGADGTVARHVVRGAARERGRRRAARAPPRAHAEPGHLDPRAHARAAWATSRASAAIASRASGCSTSRRRSGSRTGPPGTLPPADADEPNDVASEAQVLATVGAASPTRSPTSATTAATSTRSTCAPARRCSVRTEGAAAWAATSGIDVGDLLARPRAISRARATRALASGARARLGQLAARPQHDAERRLLLRAGHVAARLGRLPPALEPHARRSSGGQLSAPSSSSGGTSRSTRAGWPDHDACAPARRAARSRPAPTNASSPISTPGSRIAAPPMRAPRRIDRALHERAAPLGAAHEVVVRRDHAGRDEDVVLELAVGRDVGLGLDRARARRCVVSFSTVAPRPTTLSGPMRDALAHDGEVADDHALGERRAREDDRARSRSCSPRPTVEARQRIARARSTGRRAPGACRARRCRRPRVPAPIEQPSCTTTLAPNSHARRRSSRPSPTCRLGPRGSARRRHARQCAPVAPPASSERLHRLQHLDDRQALARRCSAARGPRSMASTNSWHSSRSGSSFGMRGIEMSPKRTLDVLAVGVGARRARDALVVDRDLAVGLHVVEDDHLLRADDRQLAHLVRVEPAQVEVRDGARRELEVAEDDVLDVRAHVALAARLGLDRAARRRGRAAPRRRARRGSRARSRRRAPGRGSRGCRRGSRSRRARPSRSARAPSRAPGWKSSRWPTISRRSAARRPRRRARARRRRWPRAASR